MNFSDTRDQEKYQDRKNKISFLVEKSTEYNIQYNRPYADDYTIFCPFTEEEGRNDSELREALSQMEEDYPSDTSDGFNQTWVGFVFCKPLEFAKKLKAC